MRDLLQLSGPSRFLVSVAVGASLGASLGAAMAQDRPPGQLDVDCSNRCAANGYDAEFCGQVCWVPDQALAARGSTIDWKCTKGCLDRGGQLEDCQRQCRRR